MVLRMARPTTRKGTANIQFQKRIPADVKKILDKLPQRYRPKGWGKEQITISTGTADKREAAIIHARLIAEVEERFERLRKGPRSLTQKEVTALAGEMYKAWADGLEDNPGTIEKWNAILVGNLKARAGKSGRGQLLIGAEAKRRAAMEDRFGPLVDASLTKEGLIVDEPSRQRLIEEFAFAIDQAALKLKANASGDYRPNDIAKRFPAWSNPVSSKTPRKLTLMALFDKWSKHPEQEQQAPKTVSRYKTVFESFDRFTNHADANEVTLHDVRLFTDELMALRSISPRTVRDVYKAAISSIFNWAVGKGLVQTNPASGISIKVKKSTSVRSKEASDREAILLVTECLKLESPRPQTIEAAKRWCPLLCLYSGARIGEVTQLRLEDFKLDGNVQYMTITPDAGTVKDRQFRNVPLHPRLFELGLRNFLSTASSGPLFYDPKAARRTKGAKTPRSEIVAGNVERWVRQTSITDPALKKPMHSLRHRFVSLARKAGIDTQYSAAITGHSQTGQHSQYGSFDLVTLMREMTRLDAFTVEGRRSNS